MRALDDGNKARAALIIPPGYGARVSGTGVGEVAFILEVQLAKLGPVALADAAITGRAFDPGEVALPAAPLLTLSRLDDLSVTVCIAGERYGQIALGLKAEFTPSDTQTADGRRTTVFAVRLKLGEGGGRLKPGLPVDVVFGP